MSNMPETIWIHKSGYWYPIAPKDRRSQPRTKYIRADIHPQQDVQGLVDLIEECRKSIHASHQKEGGKLGLLLKIDDVLKSYQEGRG